MDRIETALAAREVENLRLRRIEAAATAALEELDVLIDGADALADQAMAHVSMKAG